MKPKFSKHHIVVSSKNYYNVIPTTFNAKSNINTIIFTYLHYINENKMFLICTNLYYQNIRKSNKSSQTQEYEEVYILTAHAYRLEKFHGISHFMKHLV